MKLNGNVLRVIGSIVVVCIATYIKMQFTFDPNHFGSVLLHIIYYIGMIGFIVVTVGNFFVYADEIVKWIKE